MSIGPKAALRVCGRGLGSTRVGGGFTVVELLVLLCGLVILAALVAPQFAAASSASVKDGIRWELGRAADALWLYERDAGGPAELGIGELGWGALLSEGYLEAAPYNGFVGSSRVDPGQGQLPVMVGPSAGDAGWGVFEGVLFAVGYDASMNVTSLEAGYTGGPHGFRVVGGGSGTGRSGGFGRE